MELQKYGSHVTNSKFNDVNFDICIYNTCDTEPAGKNILISRAIAHKEIARVQNDGSSHLRIWEFESETLSVSHACHHNWS